MGAGAFWRICPGCENDSLNSSLKQLTANPVERSCRFRSLKNLWSPPASLCNCSGKTNMSESFMSIVPMNHRYNWQQEYEAAILETDPQRRLPRVVAAQGAINARLRQLQSDSGGTPEERQSLIDAMRGLQILRQDLA
jgi:hypothetical protein